MVNKKGNDYLVTIVVILTCFLIVKDKFTAKSSDLSPAAIAAVQNLGLPSSDNQETVVVFSASWCGACRALENDLRKLKTQFHSLDIEKNYSAAVAFEKVVGARSGPIPVSVVGSKSFVGNQSKAISELALAKSKPSQQ